MLKLERRYGSSIRRKLNQLASSIPIVVLLIGKIERRQIDASFSARLMADSSRSMRHRETRFQVLDQMVPAIYVPAELTSSNRILPGAHESHLRRLFLRIWSALVGDCRSFQLKDQMEMFGLSTFTQVDWFGRF